MVSEAPGLGAGRYANRAPKPPFERVMDRLRAAEQVRVLLVAAPGGYGKSTALRQYVSSIGMREVCT